MKIIEVLHEKTQDFMYFPKKEDLVFTEYVASLRRFLMTANFEFTSASFAKKTNLIPTLAK